MSSWNDQNVWQMIKINLQIREMCLVLVPSTAVFFEVSSKKKTKRATTGRGDDPLHALKRVFDPL